ncbi:MAG TPA: PilN domain-containing protein [Gammaproteobacteria bacterium]|nr:PilN domain-containing protein [Gammaproteobacteria bacterium]
MHTLNLLPLQQHPAQFFLQSLWRRFVVGVIAIGLLLMCAYGINNLLLHTLSQKITVLEAKHQTLEPSVQHARQLSEKITTYTAYQAKITVVREEYAALLDFLSTLTQMNDAIYLIELSWSHPIGQLEGYALNERSVLEWMQALKNQGFLKQWVWINQDSALQNASSSIHFIIDVSAVNH